MEFEKRKIKLFALSGKARSGKDFTYNLIENYYKDKKVINLAYGYYIKEYAKRISNWDGSEETKPRTLLQNIGIELVRTHIDKDLFTRRMLEDILVYSYFYDIIVVTDVRLLNEIESLKEAYPDLISIRVDRDEENNLSEKEQQHLTEVDLDHYDGFTYIVKNDKDFENKIIEILKEN